MPDKNSKDKNGKMKEKLSKEKNKELLYWIESW